jgi:Zn-dependent protease with chaperone function
MMTRWVLCALLLLLLSLPPLPVGAQDDGLEDALSSLPPREQAIYRKQLLQLDRVASRLLQAIPNVPQVNFILAAGENSINAGTTSGKIIVTEGMMHFVNSDDELAMILGHELAHLTQGHVQRGEMNNVLLGLGSAVAGVFLPGASQATSLVGQMFLNHFNQDQEREADRVGLQYVYAAGYDPTTAVRVMDRMAQEVPETATAGFFSSHPGSIERAQALHQLAAQFGGRPTEQKVAKRDSAQRPELERDEAACERAKQYFYRAKDARNPGEKVTLYQQGLRACPQSPRAHAELADAYADLGDEDKAVREFRQTLRYDPHYPGAEGRLHELEDRGSGVEY